MLAAATHAEKAEVLMSFPEELLLLQIHTVAGNDFPGPPRAAARRGGSLGAQAERAAESLPA